MQAGQFAELLRMNAQFAKDRVRLRARRSERIDIIVARREQDMRGLVQRGIRPDAGLRVWLRQPGRVPQIPASIHPRRLLLWLPLPKGARDRQ